MIAHIAGLRWRIIRHGPHDERGFSLVAGGVVAAGIVLLAQQAATGAIDPGWVVVALTAFGLTWLLGPVLLPGAAPIVDPQWFRTLPRRPWRIACAMAVSEPMSVGTVITAIALVGIVVLGLPHGLLVSAVAVVAAVAQLSFLLWLGRCSGAVVGVLLRSTAGIWVAAVQMSLLLAVSFAGWVPVAALVLPRFAEGDAEVVAPSAAALTSVPPQLVDVLLALPTGWGPAAVYAAAGSAPLSAVLAPVLGLVLSGAVLCAVWIVLMSHTLRTPPARTRSTHTIRTRSGVGVSARAESTRASALGGTSAVSATPAIRTTSALSAVVMREVRTWFRDPQRSLELRHAWLTPLLMLAIIVPTNWSWALPFVGVMAAVIAAMVAVNTYALDGTALWQLLTTPGAFRADVRGRQLAWMMLFGLPVIAGTVVLCITTFSHFWDVALGATLAAVGAGCGAAPLMGVLMPAIGADARDRVATGHNVGNAAGGQFTVFPLVAGIALLPPILVHQVLLPLFVAEHGTDKPVWAWSVHLLTGMAVGALAYGAFDRLTLTLLPNRGPALLTALSARDSSRLRDSSSRTT